MNTDKAYIFGLIIGGGIFGSAEEVFRIRLPYKQWGAYTKTPQNAPKITQDIMRVVSPILKSTYGISVSFDTSGGGVWNILCEGDLSGLKADLMRHGIKCEGELRQHVSISGVVAHLVDDNLKRRFIAGLADTIGSVAKSHRRFSDEIQIMSFEINGFDFGFVCELCKLLYSIKCYPDQILWNHPNFHCANNPYYKQWNKGFKLRIQLDQYAQFGAFAFRTKAESAKENRQLQQQAHEANPCPDREVRATVSCVHRAENDSRVPDCIRGGHYLHNRHVCAVLGCEHAPYAAIEKLLCNSGELITPFPVLCKDTQDRVTQIITNDPLLAKRKYRKSEVSVHTLLNPYQACKTELLYGTNKKTGYPITEVLQAVAYVIADDSELNGARIKGNFAELIERHLAANPDLTVEVRRPDLLTPLVICANDRAALVGAKNPQVYAKLVTFAPDNKYKLCVRPITEEDLRNA